MKRNGIRQSAFKELCIMKKLFLVLIIIATGMLSSNFAFAQTKYTIQLGGFKTEAGAESLRNKLMASGFDFYEVEENLTLINHGIFDLYSEAQDAKKKLDVKGFDGFIKKISQDIIPESYLNTSATIESYSQEKSNNALNVIIEDDIVFTGVYGGQVLFFTVNENWAMSDDGYMNLRYSHSLPETYRGSTMTILINGVPVHTELLNNKTENIEEVRFKVKKESLREGVNELTIRTYHRLTDRICDDDTNPGNWVVIFKNSHLHLDYKQKKDGNTLKEYPYPYLQFGGNSPVSFEFVLSESYTKDDLKAALLLSSDMGKRIQFENLSPPIKVYSSNENYTDHVIYVGNADGMPGILKETLTENEIKTSRKSGLIKEVESPFNSRKKALLMVSDDYNQMLKSVQVLSRETTNNQLNSNVIVVDDMTWLNSASEQMDEYVTFEEMGYNQITMSGQRFASAIIDYKVSDEWVLREDAHLFLKLRYTDVIDFDNSSVSVKINGIPIFSKKLVAEGVEEDAFFVKLPEEVRHFNFLRVEINFTLDVVRDCTSGSFDPNVWAYISNESYFYLPHDERLTSSLSNYPYPLISNGVFNDFKLVIQEDLEIEKLGALFSHLGHSMKELSDFELYYDSEDVPLEGNILFIGNPDASEFMETLNDYLSIGYDQSLKAYRRENLDLLSLDDTSVSVLQMAKLTDGVVLALTGLDDDHLKDAMHYLYDFEYVNKLSGFVNAIFFNGKMEVLIEDESEQKIVTIDQKREINTEALQRISGSEVRQFIIFIAIILFGILIVVILRRHR